MGREPRWTENIVKKGICNARISHWKYFSDYVNQELLDYTTYVYRGHGSSTWKLEPTLDRIIKSPVSDKREALLNSFKYATRGRRGPNPPKLKNDNDWWALGQHHGLHTPLLDWTESPFVALFFAAESAYKRKSRSLSIFALSQAAVVNNNKYILENDDIELINSRKPTVNIVDPLSDENSRLVSQRGLFTRGPNNMDLESWIKKFHQSERMMELIKITIPTKGITDCLRYLNRMNINHSTLFPDLTGASENCNKHLKIKHY